MPLLQCQNLTVSRGRRPLLVGVSLSLQAGERAVLTGPSGAGKSTLLRAIAGLEPLSAGEIHIGDRPATAGPRLLLPPHRRGVGMMLQDLGLWPSMTVLQHLRLAAGTRQEAASLLDALGLAALARRKPGTLSGGEQQRTALGAALAGAPALLLLDEPFQGLDVVLRDQLLALVDKLAADRGCALLCVTHDPDEALRLRAQRILIMESARLSADLPWQSLATATAASESATLRAWQARLFTS